MEDASQQHLTLMCSMVTKQQQQIVSMKKVINNLAVNQSGKLYYIEYYIIVFFLTNDAKQIRTRVITVCSH